VEVALGQDRDALHEGLEQVSILVFVEVALGRRNPYARVHPYCVSILVFVEVALGLAPAHRRPGLAPEFQSLFSWKSPSDPGTAFTIQDLIEGFNPCFRGSRPRTLAA